MREAKVKNIQRSTQRAPFEFCLCVLIYALFLIIFLLFTSLDTSGTWKMNMPATKASTRDAYSASLGSENFILAKTWSQDPLFKVTSFLSILSMSSEFSTGHAFHLFNLIFSVVTSFMHLSEEKYQKNKKKKSKNPKKTTTAKNREKREGQKWNNIQSSTQRAPFGLCLRVLMTSLFLIIFLLFTSLNTSGTWNVNRPATKTSTRDTYSSLSGLKILISAKKMVKRSYFCGHNLFVNFKHIL